MTIPPFVTINVADMVAHQIAPFWMLTRWDRDGIACGIPDLCDVEREEAKRAGVTHVDDFGYGLAYNRKDDADRMAVAMAERVGIPFGVFGPGDDGQDGVWLALPPKMGEGAQ